MKKSLVIATVAMIATGAGLASAGGLPAKGMSVHSTKVSFVRANSQSTEGAAELYTRLQAASQQVCADGRIDRGVADRDYQACMSAALSQAVKEVNIPAVSALHSREGTVEVLVSR